MTERPAAALMVRSDHATSDNSSTTGLIGNRPVGILATGAATRSPQWPKGRDIIGAMQRPESFLGGLSAEAFLSTHWQTTPLLVKAALPGYQPPLDAHELAGLACEPDVESRLIRQTPDDRWLLEHGPFDAERFSRLPESRWTLLVQDLEQHVPEINALLQLLDFLPAWRVDDVMASFAAPAGSVGPHYDEYDVFLLQVEGYRRWEISDRVARDQLRDDTPLRLLREFKPQQRWLLGPGDMLYLPPGVAHFGVAEGPCVTYSLGCRAPSISELVAMAARTVMDEAPETRRVTAERESLRPARHEITTGDAALVLAQLQRAFDWRPEQAQRLFGRLTTLPKALFARDDIEPLARAETRALLGSPDGLMRRKGSRWAHCVGEGQRYLFVDGLEYPTTVEPELLERLCNAIEHAAAWVRARMENEAEQRLLFDLVRDGHLE